MPGVRPRLRLESIRVTRARAIAIRLQDLAVVHHEGVAQPVAIPVSLDDPVAVDHVGRTPHGAVAVRLEYTVALDEVCLSLHSAVAVRLVDAVAADHESLAEAGSVAIRLVHAAIPELRARRRGPRIRLRHAGEQHDHREQQHPHGGVLQREDRRQGLRWPHREPRCAVRTGQHGTRP